MKVEDFAAWLSAISGMSEDQRREAMVALEKASVVGGAAQLPPRRAASAAARRTGSGPLASSAWRLRGVPIALAREIVGWGRSHGLSRFRCSSCGRTFNTLTKTTMAHLRKKQLLARSRARMIPRARAWRRLRRSACSIRLHCSVGVHPFSRAPLQDSSRGFSRNRPADETFVFSNPSRADGPTCRRRRQGVVERPGLPRPSPGQASPSSSPRSATAATFDARGATPAQVDGASASLALAGIVYAGQSSHRRWRQGDRQLRRRSWIAFNPLPSPQAGPAPCTCTSTPSTLITAVSSRWLNRFNGVATKNLPNYLGWWRALEAWSQELAPPAYQRRYRKRAIPTITL